jgi:hypothetical protein
MRNSKSRGNGQFWNAGYQFTHESSMGEKVQQAKKLKEL